MTRAFRIVAVALLVGACATGSPSGTAPQSSSPPGPASPSSGSASSPTARPTPEPDPTPSPVALAGSFDVGGRELFISCSGSGSPTIVYLHGWIDSPDFSGLSSARQISDLLDDRYRVCRYDRSNTGRSGPAEGPLTGESTIADLRALLAAAEVPGPYVLLGASFGGLLANMYAITYPDDVLGMVLLDPSLPDEVSRVDEVYLPDDYQLQPDDWAGTSEKIDRLTTYRQAEAMIGREPEIPVLLLTPNDFEIPAELPVASMTPLLRTLQEELVERYGSGEVIFVAAPHYMEPVIPDRIADEFTRLIEDLLPAG
jgi:pimeloyl-ACP methyl ester carboxylesterase